MIENLEGEIWEIHPIYTDYAASNLGRIKSLERKIIRSNNRPYSHQEQLIKPYHNRDGYWQFNVQNKFLGIDDQPFVHRFVYECFHKVIIPKGHKDLEINHIDENPSNNRIENLELCTPQYNHDYGTRNERASKAISKSLTNNPKISKKVGQYTLEGDLVKIWESTAECGRNSFNHGNVAACCRNEYFHNNSNNIYKGYKWKYIDE